MWPPNDRRADRWSLSQSLLTAQHLINIIRNTTNLSSSPREPINLHWTLVLGGKTTRYLCASLALSRHQRSVDAKGILITRTLGHPHPCYKTNKKTNNHHHGQRPIPTVYGWDQRPSSCHWASGHSSRGSSSATTATATGAAAEPSSGAFPAHTSSTRSSRGD